MLLNIKYTNGTLLEKGWVSNVVRLFFEAGWLVLKEVMFVVTNMDMYFFCLWAGVLACILSSSARNPLYRIINLIFLSLLFSLSWGFFLEFTFINLSYIMAFTGAVIMLFISVILMLPASLVVDRVQKNFFFIWVFTTNSDFRPAGIAFERPSYSAVAAICFIAGSVLFLYCYDLSSQKIARGVVCFFKLKKSWSPVAVSAHENFDDLVKTFSQPFRANLRDAWFAIKLSLNSGVVINSFFLSNAFLQLIEEGESLNSAAENQFVHEHKLKLLKVLAHAVADEKKHNKCVAPRKQTLLEIGYEFMSFFFVLIDGLFFRNSAEQRTIWVNQSFSYLGSHRFFSYPWLHAFVMKGRNLYRVYSAVWEQEHIYYPSLLSKGKKPFVIARKSFITHALDWWSPFKWGKLLLQLVANLTDGGSKKPSFKSLPMHNNWNSLKAYFFSAFQAVFSMWVFLLAIPSNLNIENKIKVIFDTQPAFVGGELDSLTELKHILYESFPLLMLASVLVLLVALIGAAILTQTKFKK